MKDPFGNLPEQARALLKEKKQPRWTRPMLATLTEDRFSDDDWIFERKLDGERCLGFREGQEVRLLSRNRKELNIHYPELADGLSRQSMDHFIVDGEVVAFQKNVTSFVRLQGRMHVEDAVEARQTGIAVFYYLFDALFLDRYDTTGLPLKQRKSLLKKTFTFTDPLRFLNHRNREGEAYLNDACQKGWEGIIAKEAAAPYVHGRSTRWLKMKCVNRQELVIGGFTEPQGERTGFGALLLGFYEEDRFRYAGKVGTGFDEATLNRLHGHLSSMERKTSPFGIHEARGSGIHWVSPRLVAEIEFTEWTRDDRLRHPRFVGLRRDKDPRSVVKEKPPK